MLHLHFIALPPNDLQILRVGRVNFDFFAQMSHMHRYGVFRADGGAARDAPIDFLRGKNNAGLLHQKLQNVVFAPREADFFAVFCYALLGVTQLNPAHTQNILGKCAAKARISAQLGAHARHQFKRGKWLCHIVVRTDVQTEHLIRVLRFCREHDYGDVGACANFSERFDSVHARHHDIQQHKLHRRVIQGGERLLAAVGAYGLMPLCSKIDTKCRNNIPVVVANQNSCHSVLRLSFFCH